ncbi:MAG: hypothetical protein GY861_06045 [bacterium]|nr:hypothetical protein [bacterium]
MEKEIKNEDLATNLETNTDNEIVANTEKKSKKKKKDKIKDPSFLPSTEEDTILWFSVSVSAQIGGVQDKTIRRAIKSHLVKYKVTSNRYLVEFKSLIIFIHSNTKLKNKFYQFGLGQHIKEWK